jgi:hypothetical protein
MAPSLLLNVLLSNFPNKGAETSRQSRHTAKHITGADKKIMAEDEAR